MLNALLIDLNSLLHIETDGNRYSAVVDVVSVHRGCTAYFLTELTRCYNFSVVEYCCFCTSLNVVFVQRLYIVLYFDRRWICIRYYIIFVHQYQR